MDSTTLRKFDWDFFDVPDEELTACSHYEYARESPSIVRHYADGSRPPEFPQQLTYSATIEGTQVRLPNPFVWIWSPSWGKLFSQPWQEMPAQWRRPISDHYQ